MTLEKMDAVNLVRLLVQALGMCDLFDELGRPRKPVIN